MCDSTNEQRRALKNKNHQQGPMRVGQHEHEEGASEYVGEYKWGEMSTNEGSTNEGSIK